MWPPTDSFDIIFCRNVLIYWTTDIQRRVATALGQRLTSNGWLVVSPAEAVAEWYRPLRPNNFPNAIFFKRQPEESASRHAGAPIVVLSPTAQSTPSRKARAKAPRPTVLSKSPLPPAVANAAIAPDAIAKAQALADQGLLQEARIASEAILATDSLDIDAYLLLASVCEELGDIPAAFEAGRRAVYLVPDSAVAHFRLGAVLATMGQDSQARRSFMTVLDLLQWLPDDALVGQHADVTVGVLRYAANSYLTDAPLARAVNDHG
jgi:tetratricopeptide (TPR) repeat protein